MDKLEDLVRFETANSGLAFREHAYRADDRADLLRDLIALANAAVTGPRFLFLGIADTPGGEPATALGARGRGRQVPADRRDGARARCASHCARR